MTGGIQLTSQDRNVILAQCRNQGATSPGEIAAFSRAYRRAKAFARDAEWERVTPGVLLSLVLELGALTDGRNQTGYRQVPVLFRSGNRGLDHRLIERAMQHWAEAALEGRLAPTDVHREFELIHPSVDGNGRVGDLLWKLFTQRASGRWRAELPPETFDPLEDPSFERRDRPSAAARPHATLANNDPCALSEGERPAPDAIAIARNALREHGKESEPAPQPGNTQSGLVELLAGYEWILAQGAAISFREYVGLLSEDDAGQTR